MQRLLLSAAVVALLVSGRPAHAQLFGGGGDGLLEEIGDMFDEVIKDFGDFTNLGGLAAEGRDRVHHHRARPAEASSSSAPANASSVVSSRPSSATRPRATRLLIELTCSLLPLTATQLA